MTTAVLPPDLAAATASPDALRRFLDALPALHDGQLAERASQLAATPTPAVEHGALLDAAIAVTDLTTLEADDTPDRVRRLAATARQPDADDPGCPSVAAVCVYPDLVGVAATALQGSDVRAASVAGAFPSSRSPLAVKVAEVTAAVADGADEIDCVLDRGALLDGREFDALSQLVAIADARGDAHLKVILETGALGDATTIQRAAWLAFLAGADVVKTSTGKDGPGASLAATLVLVDVAQAVEGRTGRTTGVKASGGIRTADEAIGYLRLVVHAADATWLTPQRFRFGASSLLADLVAARRAAR